jgi:hypothetical protein
VFKRIGASIAAWFKSLNTHLVGGVGLGTGAVSIASIILQPVIDHALNGSPAGRMLVPVIDYYATSLAAPVTATALGAAYFGRPKTISPGP